MASLQNKGILVVDLTHDLKPYIYESPNMSFELSINYLSYYTQNC